MAYVVEKASVPSFRSNVHVADHTTSLDRRMSPDPAPSYSRDISVANQAYSALFTVRGEEEMYLLPHGPDADRLTVEITADQVAAFLNEQFSKKYGRERDDALANRSLKRVSMRGGEIEQKVMTREQYQAFTAYAAKAPGHSVITACINNVGTIDELFNLALTFCSIKDLGYIVYKAELEIQGNYFDHPHASNRLAAMAAAVKGWLDDKV
jgi:hypothetical protein